MPSKQTQQCTTYCILHISYLVPRISYLMFCTTYLVPRTLHIAHHTPHCTQVNYCSRPWRQRRHSLPSLVISCLFYLTCKYISLPAALVLSFVTYGFHTTTSGDHAFQTPRSQPPRTYTCYVSSAARRLVFCVFFADLPPLTML